MKFPPNRVMLDNQHKITGDINYLDGTCAPAKKKRSTIDKTKKGKGTKTMLAVDGTGIPLTFLIESANISEFKLALPTIDQISVTSRLLHPRKRPDMTVADKGYDAQWLRNALSKRGIQHRIPRRRKRGTINQPKYNKRIMPYYRTRWIVERTIAWFMNYRRITVRWDSNPDSYEAFIELACILICLRRVER